MLTLCCGRKLGSPQKGFILLRSKKNDRRRNWARTLIDEKGVAFKYDNLWQGSAEIIVHRNLINESLLYDANLCYSPSPSSIPTLPPNTTTVARRSLPQRDTDVVKSCATHLYISPTAPHSPPNTSTQFLFCRHSYQICRVFVGNGLTANPSVGERSYEYEIHHAVLHQHSSWCQNHLRC